MPSTILIPLKKVKVGGEIGRGAYGRVFEIEWRKTHYAAKEIHSMLLGTGQDKNIKISFIRECHIWSHLHHPCIVKFIGSFSSSIYSYMHAYI